MEATGDYRTVDEREARSRTQNEERSWSRPQGYRLRSHQPYLRSSDLTCDGHRARERSRERETSVETKIVFKRLVDGTTKRFRETVTRTRVEEIRPGDDNGTAYPERKPLGDWIRRIYTIGETDDRPVLNNTFI